MACGTGSKDETLLNHANTGDNAGGVGTKRDASLDNRGAVELGEKTTT